MKPCINAISSSSKGNAIIVTDSGSSILLDCGLTFSRLIREVSLSGIEAVLLTHEHLDHAKSAEKLLHRGVEVYMTHGTAKALGINKPWRGFVKSLHQFSTKSWSILPFDVEHDASEPVGFLLQNKSSGNKYIYAVDAPRINYDFKGVNYWLVESNYSSVILDNSNYKEFIKDRVRRSHMSIENLIVFLKSSDLSQTKEIWLCHLSDANSDERAFIDEVQAATGVPVFAAGGK